MKKVCCLLILLILSVLSFIKADNKWIVCLINIPATTEPVKLSWEMLRDVTFKKKWHPEESVYMLYPTFGPAVQRLNGKEVELTGYVLPVDYESNFYVLSAFPYSACFFCGGAGPESVVALKFKKNNRKFKTDERRSFRGILKLNVNNIYELNYIIVDAEIVE